MILSLLVVGRDRASLAAFLARNPYAVKECGELILLDNSFWRFPSQAALGNWLIENAHGDVAGMIHDDTAFGAGDLERLGAAALGGKVAGLVGRALSDNVGVAGGYVWGKDVAAETPVSTLDGCSVFFPKAIKARFDPMAFNRFHCAVEDFCLSAAAAKYPVVVPALSNATHEGIATVRSGEWQKEYRVYRDRLQQKWGVVPFRTT